MARKRVVVAMSGGVDSSAALALLKEEGFDCIGVSMQLWDYSSREDSVGATSGSCCSLDDIHDARSVADRIGVPFYVVNMQDAFGREVVDYFIKAYAAGTTPNPCIKCNQILKFEMLLKKAAGLEADYLATGHYARIVPSNGTFKLLKGVDRGKDQSYFLFTMTREQMSRVLFPLGGLTKKEVRAFARSLGLKTSEKKESQEICFVREPSYADFLSGRINSPDGEIIDSSGKALGVHKGLFNYTVGQRKGLSLSGGPFYVLDLDIKENRLVVGREGELYAKGLVADGVSWINPEAGALSENSALSGVQTKIRYRHGGADSFIRKTGKGTVEVIFTTPQRAVTPGQAAVFYMGEEVVGGGWIERAIR